MKEQELQNKYFGNPVLVEPIKNIIESMGFIFKKAYSEGFYITFEFEKNGIQFEFNVRFNDDSVGYQQGLEWHKSEFDMDYYDYLYIPFDFTTETIAKALKRRLVKWLKNNDTPAKI